MADERISDILKNAEIVDFEDIENSSASTLLAFAEHKLRAYRDTRDGKIWFISAPEEARYF